MKPMLASATTAEELPRGPGWTYEVKWDGFRALASSREGRLRLTSRSGSDLTGRFPTLAALGEVTADGTVLDGEVVGLVAGVPSFEALAGASTRSDVRVVLVLFDVLVHAGRDVTALPLQQRRELLARLRLPTCAMLSETFDDGPALLAATAEQGLEGVVAKRLGSPYRPGVRSRDWLKYAHRASRRALVAGWRPEPGGSRQVASLLLAAPDATGALRWLGRAGSGIGADLAARLHAQLDPLDAPAPVPQEPLPRTVTAGVRWCRPEVVVRVAYRERTAGGQLRHPVVLGPADGPDVDPWEEP